jgi:carnitine O-palmitoyltransferase 2
MEANKLGADGFLQISLQIAHNELHGHPCATYESASTCAYQHGRTETIRPCTLDTRAVANLYKNEDLDDKDIQKKIDLALRKAIKTHNTV